MTWCSFRSLTKAKNVVRGFWKRNSFTFGFSDSNIGWHGDNFMTSLWEHWTSGFLVQPQSHEYSQPNQVCFHTFVGVIRRVHLTKPAALKATFIVKWVLWELETSKARVILETSVEICTFLLPKLTCIQANTVYYCHRFGGLLKLRDQNLRFLNTLLLLL